jgi:hypothetical protein
MVFRRNPRLARAAPLEREGGREGGRGECSIGQVVACIRGGEGGREAGRHGGRESTEQDQKEKARVRTGYSKGWRREGGREEDVPCHQSIHMIWTGRQGLLV